MAEVNTLFIKWAKGVGSTVCLVETILTGLAKPLRGIAITKTGWQMDGKGSDPTQLSGVTDGPWLWIRLDSSGVTDGPWLWIRLDSST
jgi:hypothetical protein